MEAACQLYEADCLTTLADIAASDVRFHSCITDPPYHLTSVVDRFGKEGSAPAKHGTDGAFSRASAGFMGKQWDGGDIAFRPETWRAVYDVLLPGAYLVAFASTRGYHRMVCAIEDAGFVIHPMLAWVFGSGFPKAADASKAIDRHLGKDKEREVIGHNPKWNASPRAMNPGGTNPGWDAMPAYTAPATPEAAAWEGWKYGLQSLKPAMEPICLAQRPMEGSGAQSILKHGCGALNIGASRISGNVPHTTQGQAASAGTIYGADQRVLREFVPDPAGRYPANLLHDGSPEVLAAFAAFGESRDGVAGSRTGTGKITSVGLGHEWGGYGGSGSPARFFTQCPLSPDELRMFYCPKAGKKERRGSRHPAVKPLKLMRWLVNLVTPPDGIILDPFAGTGMTGEAALSQGFNITLMEREAEYCRDIRRRIPEVI